MQAPFLLRASALTALSLQLAAPVGLALDSGMLWHSLCLRGGNQHMPSMKNELATKCQERPGVQFYVYVFKFFILK